MADSANDGGEQKPDNADVQSDEGGGAPDPKPAADVVSKDQFEHVMGDMHRYKKTAKELADENKRLKEEQLAREKNWEELAKNREKERDEALAERDSTKQAFIMGEKRRAVQAAVQQLGIRSEALKDIPMLQLKGVEVQTTSDGQLNILGADVFAQTLKNERPHWFNQEKAPNLATGGNVKVTPEGGAVTLDMLVKAEREANKNGDRSAYEAMVAKYQSQRRG